MNSYLRKEYWPVSLWGNLHTTVPSKDLPLTLNSMAMAPGVASTGQYFNKKRGAAMGIAVAGSSLGGVIFPYVSTSPYSEACGYERKR